MKIGIEIGTFADVADLCPKQKLQLIDNYSYEHRCKCADPFSIHKQLVKTILHEVALSEFHTMFSTYNVLLGRVCLKCFKRAKDNVAVSTITIENEVEMDDKEEKNDISVKTSHDLVDKSLELFDFSPLKNVKVDRTLHIGKRKISKVINAFSKAITIAPDEPTLGRSTDCYH